MYAFAMSMYAAGLREFDLIPHMMAHTPYDSDLELYPGRPFYILHYTYGLDFNQTTGEGVDGHERNTLELSVRNLRNPGRDNICTRPVEHGALQKMHNNQCSCITKHLSPSRTYGPFCLSFTPFAVGP